MLIFGAILIFIVMVTPGGIVGFMSSKYIKIVSFLSNDKGKQYLQGTDNKGD